MNIVSPLTYSDDVVLEKNIPVAEIIELYKAQCNIDTSRFFANIKEISIYKCNKTGYRFYYPFDISGDGKFYEALQALPGYYPEWKWEHSKVKEFIKDADHVLEIGCAEGSFLEVLQESNIEGVGLELNDNAVDIGKRKGINIKNQSIQDHAIDNVGKYDLVCSFQVMEHITSIREVLLASINCLKRGGLLFISVPNNDSFLKYDERHTLNMPPHHMGLWNKQSLKSLEKIFPIKFDSVFFEEPLPHHKYLFDQTFSKLLDNKKRERVDKLGLVGKVMNRFLTGLDYSLIKKDNPTLGNFTIIAKYTKL